MSYQPYHDSQPSPDSERADGPPGGMPIFLRAHSTDMDRRTVGFKRSERGLRIACQLLTFLNTVVLIASIATKREMGPFYVTNIVSLIFFSIGLTAATRANAHNISLRLWCAQFFFISTIIMWIGTLSGTIIFMTQIADKWHGEFQTAAYVITPFAGVFGLALLWYVMRLAAFFAVNLESCSQSMGLHAVQSTCLSRFTVSSLECLDSISRGNFLDALDCSGFRDCGSGCGASECCHTDNTTCRELAKPETLCLIYCCLYVVGMFVLFIVCLAMNLPARGTAWAVLCFMAELLVNIIAK